MTTRYKARSGGKHPDLDMLDTMYDENEQVHTNRGAKAATEASRGALDFYRLKAAPPVDPASLRNALAHALGATLATKALKQTPADKIAMMCQRIADKSRAWSTTQGGDEGVALRYLQDVLDRIPGQTGRQGGSLADDQAPLTKEVRGDPFWDGVSDHIVQTGGIQQP